MEKQKEALQAELENHKLSLKEKQHLHKIAVFKMNELKRNIKIKQKVIKKSEKDIAEEKEKKADLSNISKADLANVPNKVTPLSHHEKQAEVEESKAAESESVTNDPDKRTNFELENTKMSTGFGGIGGTRQVTIEGKIDLEVVDEPGETQANAEEEFVKPKDLEESMSKASI